MNDNKAIIKRMFEEVFAGHGCDEALIRRYFSTEYIQCVDGKVLGFEEFLRHLRILKDATKTMLFEFKALVQEGDIVFSNHVVTGETIEGRPIAAHVIAEFRLRDGKIVSCDELTHLLSGDERDRDLGSRH